MSYAFQTVNERRVCCGRCRHQNNQQQLEDGVFDTEAALTFYCRDCHCVYAVCRICAWFMPDGKSCSKDHSPAMLLVSTSVEARDRSAEKPAAAERKKK